MPWLWHTKPIVLYVAQESVDELKARMHAQVRKEYPDPEEDKPEEAREGYVPQAVLEVLEENEAEMMEDKKRKKQKVTNIGNDKNATPGDGARDIASCLENIRPNIITVGSSANAVTDPHTAKVTALEQRGQGQAHGCDSNHSSPDAHTDAAEPAAVTGELHVQSDTTMINQWDSSYPSRILPFVIPKNVSGDHSKKNHSFEF